MSFDRFRLDGQTALVAEACARLVLSPEDIGAAALCLCSPAAAFVTGEVLVIDGGYTAK